MFKWLIMHWHQGLSGAVTSIASSPTFVASTALDRFVRVHSTSVPPQQAGQQVEKKGEVLDKVYTKSIPTVVIWDGDTANIGLNIGNTDDGEIDNEDDNVWETMQNVGDSDGDDVPRGAKRNVKKGRVE
jgi:ribosome biogenesis protein NSA1